MKYLTNNYKLYVKALNMMGKQPNIAIKEEMHELLESRSLDEFTSELSDVMHATLRAFSVHPIVSFILAYKCAMKHSTRLSNFGCPRSRRNCKKKGISCCCKGKSLPFKSA